MPEQKKRRLFGYIMKWDSHWFDNKDIIRLFSTTNNSYLESIHYLVFGLSVGPSEACFVTCMWSK